MFPSAPPRFTCSPVIRIETSAGCLERPFWIAGAVHVYLESILRPLPHSNWHSSRSRHEGQRRERARGRLYPLTADLKCTGARRTDRLGTFSSRLLCITTELDKYVVRG